MDLHAANMIYRLSDGVYYAYLQYITVKCQISEVAIR